MIFPITIGVLKLRKGKIGRNRDNISHHSIGVLELRKGKNRKEQR